MTDRNLGRFYVSYRTIRRDPDKIASIFREMNFVPLIATNNFATNQVEYIGISNLFDEVSEGDVTPLYTIVVEDLLSSNRSLIVLARKEQK